MNNKFASKEINADLFGGYPPDHYTTVDSNPVKVVISFAADATPSITNYQALYATLYSESPDVALFTIDGDGNYIKRSEQPKYVMAVGLLDSIVWDLPDAETGFIVLRK